MNYKIRKRSAVGEVSSLQRRTFKQNQLRWRQGKIIQAALESQDQFLLFFYYPDEETMSLLMTRPELTFEDELDEGDLFEGKNARERILIFSV